MPYVCVQPLGKHGSGVSKGVFMVYSDTAIDQRLAELFVGPEAHHVQHWPYTFGQLPPISIGPNASAQVQPVVLAGVDYLDKFKGVELKLLAWEE